MPGTVDHAKGEGGEGRGGEADTEMDSQVGVSIAAASSFPISSSIVTHRAASKWMSTQLHIRTRDRDT